MGGTIDMASDFSMSDTPHDTVQSGNGGEIEMYGGSDMHLSHTEISPAQKGKGSGMIDMEGDQGLISPSQHVTPYNSKTP